ncbi:MAG: SRPBCC family protein [Desulfobulbaceae bacterium]|nr:SRPBCC family protein [Desulfobulbaceae bacterium]
MYTLERHQLVRTSLENAWKLLKNPANLNTITPEDLCFEIISEVPEEMFHGLLVEYRIKIPLLGTRKWLAEIKHIRQFRSFVDEQRLGPYSFWYHYHELLPEEKGVRITDRVYYKVPFGVFGRIVHFFFIRKTLDRIFDYRKEKISAILEQ